MRKLEEIVDKKDRFLQVSFSLLKKCTVDVSDDEFILCKQSLHVQLPHQTEYQI